MMDKIKKSGAGKNPFKIQQLVQEQIDEQVNALEDSKTRENGWETLMYADEVDNKEFSSSDKAGDNLIQQTAEETMSELQDAELTRIANQKLLSEELDNSNESHI